MPNENCLTSKNLSNHLMDHWNQEVQGMKKCVRCATIQTSIAHHMLSKMHVA